MAIANIRAMPDLSFARIDPRINRSVSQSRSGASG